MKDSQRHLPPDLLTKSLLGFYILKPTTLITRMLLLHQNVTDKVKFKKTIKPPPTENIK